MKKLILLCLAVAAGYSASAQQKGKTDYMSVSIYRSGASLSDMIVTRTDSAQSVTKIKVSLPFAGGAKISSQEDNALMTLLKPYFNNGWKLVSFADVGDTAVYTEIFKYYLSKE